MSRRLLGILVALLAAWLGLAAPCHAAPVPAASAQIHAYDTYQLNSVATSSRTERGLPAPYDRSAAYSAIDAGLDGSEVRTDGPTPLATPTYDDRTKLVLGGTATGTTNQDGDRAGSGLSSLGRAGVAAKTADIGGARFARTSFSETFSKGGLFGGRSIDDVAGALRSGAMSPKDVPIDVVVRNGNTLILNTRSSQALARAGIPRGSWNVIDRTGQADYERRLSDQLGRNGLTSSGTDLP